MSSRSAKEADFWHDSATEVMKIQNVDQSQIRKKNEHSARRGAARQAAIASRNGYDGGHLYGFNYDGGRAMKAAKTSSTRGERYVDDQEWPITESRGINQRFLSIADRLECDNCWEAQEVELAKPALEVDISELMRPARRKQRNKEYEFVRNLPRIVELGDEFYDQGQSDVEWEQWETYSVMSEWEKVGEKVAEATEESEGRPHKVSYADATKGIAVT